MLCPICGIDKMVLSLDAQGHPVEQCVNRRCPQGAAAKPASSQ